MGENLAHIQENKVLSEDHFLSRGFYGTTYPAQVGAIYVDSVIGGYQ